MHLEEEDSGEQVGTKSEDLDGINGVTEKFIVHLARVVKEAQQDEKHCYHCSSMDHFYLQVSAGEDIQVSYPFKPKKGDGAREGSLDLSSQGNQAKGAPGGDTQGIGHHTQTPLLNANPFL